MITQEQVKAILLAYLENTLVHTQSSTALRDAYVSMARGAIPETRTNSEETAVNEAQPSAGPTSGYTSLASLITPAIKATTKEAAEEANRAHWNQQWLNWIENQTLDPAPPTTVDSRFIKEGESSRSAALISAVLSLGSDKVREQVTVILNADPHLSLTPDGLNEFEQQRRQIQRNRIERAAVDTSIRLLEQQFQSLKQETLPSPYEEDSQFVQAVRALKTNVENDASTDQLVTPITTAINHAVRANELETQIFDRQVYLRMQILSLLAQHFRDDPQGYRQIRGNTVDLTIANCLEQQTQSTNFFQTTPALAGLLTQWDDIQRLIFRLENSSRILQIEQQYTTLIQTLPPANELLDFSLKSTLQQTLQTREQLLRTQASQLIMEIYPANQIPSLNDVLAHYLIDDELAAQLYALHPILPRILDEIDEIRTLKSNVDDARYASTLEALKARVDVMPHQHQIINRKTALRNSLEKREQLLQTQAEILIKEIHALRSLYALSGLFNAERPPLVSEVLIHYPDDSALSTQLYALRRELPRILDEINEIHALKNAVNTISIAENIGILEEKTIIMPYKHQIIANCHKYEQDLRHSAGKILQPDNPRGADRAIDTQLNLCSNDPKNYVHENIKLQITVEKLHAITAIKQKAQAATTGEELATIADDFNQPIFLKHRDGKSQLFVLKVLAVITSLGKVLGENKEHRQGYFNFDETQLVSAKITPSGKSIFAPTSAQKAKEGKEIVQHMPRRPGPSSAA